LLLRVIVIAFGYVTLICVVGLRYVVVRCSFVGCYVYTLRYTTVTPHTLHVLHVLRLTILFGLPRLYLYVVVVCYVVVVVVVICCYVVCWLLNTFVIVVVC